MAIQSAILALNPWLYWPMQETSGTTIADVTSGGRNGTISGSVTLGITGAEQGRNSIRPFPGGLVVSAPLGFTAWASFSIMVLVSCPANAVVAQTNFLGICDRNSQVSHGFALGFTTTSVPQMRYWQQFNLYPAASPNVTTVQPYWHLVTFAYDAPAITHHNWVDNEIPTSTGGPPDHPWIASDPLWIMATQPVILSDFAFFNRALTQGEHNSVASQIQYWPYYIPTGGGGGGGGPVGLDPTDPTVTQINVDLTDIRRAVLHDYTVGPPG